MKRRELFQSVAGAIVMADIPVTTASVISAEAAPVIAVFEAPGFIREETAERMKAYLLSALKGTGFENIRVVVLSDGAKLTFFNQYGEICNESFHRHLSLRDHVGDGTECRLEHTDLQDDLRPSKRHR